jgi:hypothetical protein
MKSKLKNQWDGSMRWLMMLVCAVGTMASGRLAAQDKSPIDLLSPYLEETTLGVAWCDVEQLDVMSIASLAKTYNVPMNETAYDYAKTVAASLKTQGVVKVYSVFDAASIMETRPPLFILQVKQGADLSLVQALITPLIAPADLSAVKDGELLLVGGKKELERKLAHPAVKSERLQKQISVANRSNAICVAPSGSMSEALRMTMGLGAGDVDKQPFGLRLIILLAPMEGLRLDSSILHEGFKAVVDFDTKEKADNFKKSLSTLLANEKQLDIQQMLPQIKDSSAVWQLENKESFANFFQALSARIGGEAGKMKTSNNMKQLALALHNHHDALSIFPPQAVVSPEGKRLLSWRVLLLPFLEQNELYQRFKLDEPWDSAHNAALIKEMPEIFARPGADTTLGKTPYVAPLMKESFFGRPGAPAGFQDILDGTSNTIWFVEAPPEFEVTWTKPEDWEVKGVESVELFLKAKPQLLISLMDGSVQMLPATVTSEMILKMFTIAGGEVVRVDE